MTKMMKHIARQQFLQQNLDNVQVRLFVFHRRTSPAVMF